VLIVLAAAANRLGKQRTTPWPAAVAGPQGQGMGASNARRSRECNLSIWHHKLHCFEDAFLSVSLTVGSIPLPHVSSMFSHTSSNTNTSFTGMLAHTRLHTCTHMRMLSHACTAVLRASTNLHKTAVACCCQQQAKFIRIDQP